MYNKPGLIRKNTTQITDSETDMDLAASAQEKALAQMSDELLMQAYAGNDRLAFDELYGRYRVPLYRYMHRLLSAGDEIITELYQDVWLKLINTRQQYRVAASFKTFLYQIAINTVRDYLRRESVRQIMSTIEDESLVKDQSHQPDEKVLQDELMDRFKQELKSLPAEQREVFLLREEAGLTSVQIAEMMQISVDTVKSRMRYAVSRLKSVLTKGEL